MFAHLYLRRSTIYIPTIGRTDSGLYIDALRVVANGINRLRTPDTATILVTHY